MSKSIGGAIRTIFANQTYFSEKKKQLLISIKKSGVYLVGAQGLEPWTR
jgi:hypothetical protein